MARSLQHHLMRRACSSIQSQAILAYEEKGRRIPPFPSLIRVQLDKDFDEREHLFLYPHSLHIGVPENHPNILGYGWLSNGGRGTRGVPKLSGSLVGDEGISQRKRGN